MSSCVSPSICISTQGYMRPPVHKDSPRLLLILGLFFLKGEIRLFLLSFDSSFPPLDLIRFFLKVTLSGPLSFGTTKPPSHDSWLLLESHSLRRQKVITSDVKVECFSGSWKTLICGAWRVFVGDFPLSKFSVFFAEI